MDWETVAASTGDAENLWQSSSVTLGFVHPFLFSIQGTDCHVSDFTFLWPGSLVCFHHIVEDHETSFRADGNHLNYVELLWDFESWLQALGNIQNVLSDHWEILVHRDDRFDFIGWSEADITAAENVLENHFLFLAGNGGNWVDVGDSSLLVDQNLV